MKPMVPWLRDKKEVLACVDAYHDPSQPGDTLDYPYYLRHLGRLTSRASEPKESETRLLLNGYLRDWNGMRRTLGGVRYEADPVLDQLKELLESNWAVLRRLSNERIENVRSNEDIAQLPDLFDSIATRWIVNARKQRSPTSVGKILHILLPGLCVIWDRDYVRNQLFETSDGRSRKFGETGSGYSDYILFKASQLRELADASHLDSSAMSRVLEEEHYGALLKQSPDFAPFLIEREPVTKILDEMNYLSEEPKNRNSSKADD